MQQEQEYAVLLKTQIIQKGDLFTRYERLSLISDYYYNRVAGYIDAEWHPLYRPVPSFDGFHHLKQEDIVSESDYYLNHKNEFLPLANIRGYEKLIGKTEKEFQEYLYPDERRTELYRPTTDYCKNLLKGTALWIG